MVGGLVPRCRHYHMDKVFLLLAMFMLFRFHTNLIGRVLCSDCFSHSQYFHRDSRFDQATSIKGGKEEYDIHYVFTCIHFEIEKRFSTDTDRYP